MTQRRDEKSKTVTAGGEHEVPIEPKKPVQRPDEVPHTPQEIPNAPPREIPRDPMPTELDRERAENEGMIAPPPDASGAVKVSER
jgi:hypothetical protein